MSHIQLPTAVVRPSMAQTQASTTSMHTAPKSMNTTLGNFRINSYTPTKGAIGTLFKVHLTKLLRTAVASQGSIFVKVNGRAAHTKIIRDSDGQVTLACVLGATAINSFTGPATLAIEIQSNGAFFDGCTFGEFEFTTPVPSTSLSNSKKRAREEDEVPSSGRTVHRRLPDGRWEITDAPASPDPLQTQLNIEADFAQLANVNTWSSKEIKNGRRMIRIARRQDGSKSVLYTTIITQQEANEDPEHIINCIRMPYSSENSSDVETVYTSVDFIRCVQLIVHPDDSSLSIEEKNRIRRNVDTYKPKTLKKEDARLQRLMALPDAGSPITIDRSVKIFKWTDLESALFKIINKYSYDTSDSDLSPSPPPRNRTGPSSRSPARQRQRLAPTPIVSVVPLAPVAILPTPACEFDTSLLTINAPLFPIASESTESSSSMMSSWSTLVDSSSESSTPSPKVGCDSGFEYISPGTYFVDNTASVSPWDFSAFEPSPVSDVNNEGYVSSMHMSDLATGLAAADLPDFLIAATIGDVCSPPKVSDTFLPNLNDSDFFDGSLGLDLGGANADSSLVSPDTSIFGLFDDESLALMINSYIQV